MVVPTIALLVFASVLFLLVAKEYSEKKRLSNPIYSQSKENGSEDSDNAESTGDEDLVVSKKRLTASDTCIVISKDVEEKKITLRNIKGGNDKALSYDGKTEFLTKNDGPLTASEIMVGDIVDIEFTTFDSRLSRVSRSKDAWELNNIDKFEIDEKGKTIKIADDLYKMSSNAIIASGDKVGKLLDVTSLDTITVRGIDKDV